MSPQRTIVIVGAGFSGTLVAANLLKSQHWAATQIVLVERSANVARGKAYAERSYPYLLNVPASRMSADPNSPLDFLSFAQQRLPDATAEDFLPRELYGQYLEATLLDAEVSAAPHVQFERLRGEVCGIEPAQQASYRVQLADGRNIDAHDVVLALGNPGPADLPGTENLQQQYTSDPWARPLTFSPNETVLLVGNGLTMADVATAAAAGTQEQIVIHAISRHGLIPPSQTQFSHAPCKADSAAILRAASFSARTLLRSVRELAQETERRGGDWREAVTFIRNIAPALWQRLPAREKRRMLRHIRPYWDVHRHRLPSETLAKLNRLRQRQKLHVHAGRLLTFEIVAAIGTAAGANDTVPANSTAGADGTTAARRTAAASGTAAANGTAGVDWTTAARGTAAASDTVGADGTTAARGTAAASGTAGADGTTAARGTAAASGTAGAKVRVTWRPRGSSELQTLLVDRVVNCTGPDYNVSRSRDPLLQSLVSQGLAVPDPLNLGLRTGSYGALINAQGRTAPNLFYVGPMLRADHWEATAAHELRGHAERLAAYLSAPVGRLRAVAGA